MNVVSTHRDNSNRGERGGGVTADSGRLRDGMSKAARNGAVSANPDQTNMYKADGGIWLILFWIGFRSLPFIKSVSPPPASRRYLLTDLRFPSSLLIPPR